MALIPRFDAWFERYRLLFRDAPGELRGQIDATRGHIRGYLAREGGGWSGWDVPRTIPEAKAMLQEQFSKLRSLLDIVAPESETGRVLAIPDTSSLIDQPDLERYPEALGVTSLEVFLVPVVLSELDSLKDQGRNQDVREKARAADRLPCAAVAGSGC